MSKPHFSNTVEDFYDISVGDLLDGAAVEKVILINRDFLVYKSDNNIKYFAKNMCNIATEKLNSIEILYSKAHKKFDKVHSDTMDSYLVAGISLIFTSDFTDNAAVLNADNEIKKFSDFIDSEPAPNLVIASNGDYAVYLDSDYLIRYTIQNNSLYKCNILDEFYKLRSWGATVLSPAKIKILNLKLATCLAIGLRSKLSDENIDTSTIFSPATSFIEKTTVDTATYYLILYTVFFSSIVTVCSLCSYAYFSTPQTTNFNTFTIGLLGGVCGALISVLQRSKKLQVGLYESTKIIVLQGVIRVGLGCVFGIISLVACKSGLFLNLMNESNGRLFILAIISGFSERLIPDFIEKSSTGRLQK